jgi:hypothetical protein
MIGVVPRVEIGFHVPRGTGAWQDTPVGFERAMPCNAEEATLRPAASDEHRLNLTEGHK